MIVASGSKVGRKMLERLLRKIEDRLAERKKVRNFKFGESWEEEVRELFFVPEFYDLIEKTHNFKQNRIDYVKSSLNPDYKFLCIYTNREIYVECKARDITKMLKKTSDFLDEYDKLANVDPKKQQQLDKDNKYLQLLDLCSKEQFLRFKEISNETKVVFMVLLTSDHTYREDVISLIPIDELLSHQVFYPQILQYKIAESEVEPHQLWRNFVLFYVLPAHCIRCKKKIKYNNYNPFCFDCWKDWYNFKHFMHVEKFCHACGKSHGTTSIKPLCLDCFKKFPINLGLK